MRKLFVFFTIIGMSAGAVFAQKTRLSLTTIPQVSWLNTDNDMIESEESAFGLGFGLDVDYFFAEHYAFASSFYLMNIGSGTGSLRYQEPVPFIADGEAMLLDSSSIVDYKTAYLEIPFGLRLRTIEIGRHTFYGEVGMNLRINIDATGSAQTDNTEFFSDANLSDEVNMLNMGYHFGAGFEYNLAGSTSILFGLRYTSYFLDMTKDIGTQNIGGQAFDRTDSKVTIGSFSLRLGVLF